MGDRVVVAPYGVGIIGRTCDRPVGTETHTYYEIDFPNTRSRAYIPVNNAAVPGMRAALTVKDLEELAILLHGEGLSLPRQWSVRHQAVGALIAQGDPRQLAALICELRRWSLERRLPDLDRQAYRHALKLLSQEVESICHQEAHHLTQVLLELLNETLVH